MALSLAYGEPEVQECAGSYSYTWVEPPERAPRGTKIDHFGESMTIYTVK